ncbi:ABC transporter substrate-binding protein [uncultured Ilyobacter sp.]|uniref:ABC transporter substrate-binding protein n=1 Tax=uncultured Ilyobacter sp. TaxID=544433 RepID=UPI0029C09C1A|nr:ABC transporter substrate-binding protein [uncultured Ilyobacter sp.]
MKKIILFVFMVISLTIWGIEIDAPKAPPSIPLLAMEEIDLNFYQNVSTEVVPKIIKKKGELYVIPVNVAATLYNKGVDIRLLGVTSRGLLSFLSKEISSVEELDGKKLYIGGQGSSPDVVMRNILDSRKISPKINYRSSGEIAKLAMAGRIDNLVLPEPLATMVLGKNKDFKRVAELKDLWKGKEIPQVGIFVMGKVYDEKYIEIDKFIEEYKKALERKNEVKLLEKAKEEFSLGMSIGALGESVKYMNLTLDTGCKKSVEHYLDALGIKLPGDEFYAW